MTSRLPISLHCLSFADLASVAQGAEPYSFANAQAFLKTYCQSCHSAEGQSGIQPSARQHHREPALRTAEMDGSGNSRQKWRDAAEGIAGAVSSMNGKFHGLGREDAAHRGLRDRHDARARSAAAAEP